MRKTIIRTGTGEQFNAASKARRDAEAIALRQGYEPFVFSGPRTAEGSLPAAVRLAAAGIANWKRLIRDAEANSTVLIQYPHYPVKTAYLAKRMMPEGKRKKNLKWIALIHDLDSLRGLHGAAAAYSDREILPLFDAVICHNGRMKAYLAERGIPEEKLIPLGLFDYLTDARPAAHAPEDGLAVAGNLNPEKCGYAAAWIRDPGRKLPLHLYGKGLEETDTAKRAWLHGSFSPEELPGEMKGGFGLVWDGPETGTCGGDAGQYLRYNNPHKLSLYLASGMPAVIWRQAALADTVTGLGAGLAAESLEEAEAKIAALSGEEYALMAARARETGERIREGRFLAEALKAAEGVAEG